MKRIAFTFAICAMFAVAGQSGSRAAEKKAPERKDPNVISLDVKQFKYLVEEQYQSAFGYNAEQSKAYWYTNGVGEIAVKIAIEGSYEIKIKASGDSALNERAKFKIGFAGEQIGKEMSLRTDEVADYAYKVKAKQGEQMLTIEFTNDDRKEGEYDRNLYIHEVTLKRVR